DGIVGGLAASAMRLGRSSVQDYLDSRPVVAELEAIGRAIALAEATGCSLHIVHVSTGRGAALVGAARARGVDVTAETCPHYLVFTDEDVEQMGAIAKCAPPLRSVADQESLWSAVRGGEIDLIASDHSPSLPSMKSGDDFFAVWGGISGCQHLLAAMISAGIPRGASLPDIARLTSGTIARRFRLAGKGGIAVGNDADLTWLRYRDPVPIPASRVRYRHPASVWDDVPLAVEAAGTIMRGRIVYRDGELLDQPAGRLLKPDVTATRNWPFDERD
ncbi:MAG TPA: amidohydrolase family protein, partial [Thermomicrobiales bacterium]|nr:amidohydrolase family protein [Thermomicrobiales bacterium]